NADISMFDAKASGKNRLRFYENAMGESSSRRFALESRLKKACDENEFVVFYQPQFDCTNGELCGIEALVRWNHPELGLLSPKMFIPIAEDNGMIISIGEQILYKVCKEIKEWLNEGLLRVPVFVNISARQFMEGDLPNTLAHVLAQTELAPQHLGIEITESYSMQDVGYTIDTLKELREMGIRISIDDFGTGYSSLSYLKRFPLDTLKIDQSFVHGIPRDHENMAIVKAIVNLAHSLDLKVVAEGVETVDQIDFLRSERCDELQGFHFSKPVSSERVRNILRRARKRNNADASPTSVLEPRVVKDEHLWQLPTRASTWVRQA
ncbi:MAG: putative bifunctional diguanylate cyclase/phosphodiesterase, partial [bacterium]